MATNSEAHAQSRAFTHQDLWGDDHRPGVDDVEQKQLGDCFLVAAAGEVALNTPEVIRNGIQFDEQTGNFSVRLFKDGQWSSVAVTQDELKNNLPCTVIAVWAVPGQVQVTDCGLRSMKLATRK